MVGKSESVNRNRLDKRFQSFRFPFLSLVMAGLTDCLTFYYHQSVQERRKLPFFDPPSRAGKKTYYANLKRDHSFLSKERLRRSTRLQRTFGTFFNRHALLRPQQQALSVLASRSSSPVNTCQRKNVQLVVSMILPINELLVGEGGPLRVSYL